MMPLDLPAQTSDIDRFVPPAASREPWIGNARKQYAFDMRSALVGTLRELRLDRGEIAFDVSLCAASYPQTAMPR